MMTATDVEAIRERMEEAEARKLQPHFIRAFFLEAFRLLGGQIAKREPGRYEITRVPAEIRARGRALGVNRPVVDRYARVTFEKELVSPAGQVQAELLAPGHPLLDATVDMILQRYRPLLKQGTVLVADADPSEDPRALVYVEHAIQNAKEVRPGERQVVSRRLQFVELTEDWEARVAGYAPYLDYRPLEPEEQELVAALIESEWLDRGVEKAGLDYAIGEAVPEHLNEVREDTLRRVELTKEAVHRRLTSEIAYWDHRANELKEQELAGKQPRMNSGRARQRANDLEARLKHRMDELEKEAQLSAMPPTVVGGALVIPAGLLDRLRGRRAEDPSTYAKETARVERLAVDAVLAAEHAAGPAAEGDAAQQQGLRHPVASQRSRRASLHRGQGTSRRGEGVHDHEERDPHFAQPARPLRARARRSARRRLDRRPLHPQAVQGHRGDLLRHDERELRLARVLRPGQASRTDAEVPEEADRGCAAPGRHQSSC